LYRLDYKSIGYFSDFERYDVIIENNNSINDIYKNFNRNTKRNIKEELNIGITLHKGSKATDLEKAYNIFKKKSNNNLAYYQNLMNIYSNKDNKMEIFFAKLNPHDYLVKMQRQYELECKRNEIINNLFNKKYGFTKEKLLNKKIISDSKVEKLKVELNKAIELNKQYTESIIIGTCIIIKNNHEIYFLIDGYYEKFRDIHSTHILKWAIIKKYYSLGYRIFNLGEINKNYLNKDSKYHGQYMYKIGFGGNVVEYTPNLLLVINKPMYNLYSKLSYGKSILKR
jgi:lipid II:glycine glycyltransferase (peptidoglycan interpeptide bridge formation enzyme)